MTPQRAFQTHFQRHAGNPILSADRVIPPGTG